MDLTRAVTTVMSNVRSNRCANCMVDPGVLTYLEELTQCGVCKQKYNDTEQSPKCLSCKHQFCLRCVEKKLVWSGRDVYCADCWSSTKVPDQELDQALPTHSSTLLLANNLSHFKITTNNSSAKSGDKERKSENCHTHGMPLALWCATCCMSLCRACANAQEHPGHQIKSQTDAKEQLMSDVQLEVVAVSKLSSEIQRLVMQQREFLIKLLDACTTLKTHVETDLQNGCWNHFPEVTDARETLGKAKAGLQMSETPADVYNLHSQLLLEKQRLQSKYQEMILQCQLDDLIGNSNVIFDFTLLKQALAGIQRGDTIVPQGMVGNGTGRPNHVAASQNPILFLANYCMSQLYTRHIVSKQQQQQHHMQNGSIEYHPSMMPPPPPSSGSVHAVHQVPQPSAPPTQTGPPQQLLIPPGSPSIKTVPPASSNAAMLHPQQQSSAFMSDAVGTGGGGGGGGGSGSLVHSSPQPPPSSGITAASLRGPANPYPLYYFNIDVNGSPHGRIVIEVRPDAAPKMAKNFSVLSTGEGGVGYKGCMIFQCWEGESVITGDFELNNGRGGRSIIFEDGYFMPDDTKFPAVRGAVGMRRTQKRHDNFGMVGSQFRIILQEMRGFTGIFGHVVEGLELVEKISTFGDQTGKPTKNILITKCGKL